MLNLIIVEKESFKLNAAALFYVEYFCWKDFIEWKVSSLRERDFDFESLDKNNVHHPDKDGMAKSINITTVCNIDKRSDSNELEFIAKKFYLNFTIFYRRMNT